MSSNPNDIYQTMKMVSDASQSAIEADRLQDDRLGRQMNALTATSERSHDHAAQSLMMLLLRYGKAHLVPEALFDDIDRGGERLDRIVIDLKVAKEFPEFEIVKDPIVLQNKFMNVKQQWNRQVKKSIRAARVSTQSANAVFSTIQLLSAQKDLIDTRRVEREDDLGF